MHRMINPQFRSAVDEDIVEMSTSFTLPSHLAKQLPDREKRLKQCQEFQQQATPNLKPQVSYSEIRLDNDRRTSKT